MTGTAYTHICTYISWANHFQRGVLQTARFVDGQMTGTAYLEKFSFVQVNTQTIFVRFGPATCKINETRSDAVQF